MSHNVSDFVIRVKNAIRAKHAYVKIRNTKLNRSLSHLLRSEGFIKGLTYTNSKGWANANVVAKTVGGKNGETAFTAPKRKTYRTSAIENASERQPEEGTTSTTDSKAMIREENTSGSGAMESVLGAETPEEQRSKESDFIIVYLKHTGKRNAITDMKVISKPSARMYSSAKALPKVLGGLGTVIVTTSKGVMTDKKARSLKIGGELLFCIW